MADWDWNFVIMAPVSLFVIVDPITTVPIFLSMTPRDTPERRIQMARTACIVATCVLLFFALSGKLLFQILGISIPAFQIAGGVLLFFIGLDMLYARQPENRLTNAEHEAGKDRADIAISPLAVPLLAGPGAISATVLLESQADTFGEKLVLYASVPVIFIISYAVLRISATGARWLSPLALRLTERLTGLVLAALAVQFVLNGLAASGIARLNSP